MTYTIKVLLTLRRIYATAEQTQGILELEGDNKKYATIEKPWRNNAKQISCIPEGTYNVVGRWSKKFGFHLHILNVPNRDFILIHAGNYNKQTKGCILIGMDFKDLNNDNVVDISNSKAALEELLKKLPKGQFLIKITNENKN